MSVGSFTEKLPHDVISALQTYETQTRNSIKNKQKQLLNWYIQNVLIKINTNIPRLYILNCAYNVIKQSIPDQRYLNTLFLQQQSIVMLIKKSNHLQDIAYVLHKYLQFTKKKKQILYNDCILNQIRIQTQSLLKKNQKTLYQHFGVWQIYKFISQKIKNPQCYHPIQPFYISNIQQQALLIYNYLLKPIFQKKNLQNVYDNLYPIIIWFLAINDNSKSNQQTLKDMAKKIDSFLWVKKSTNSYAFIKGVSTVFNLLSVKYIKQSYLHVSSLTPLLIKLEYVQTQQVMEMWHQEHKQKHIMGKHIENILRNILSLGCLAFFMNTISVFSQLLKKHRKYQPLLYLFNSFIRKQYLNIKLPNSEAMKIYLDILMIYTIGFINTDRLDGETQLDQLAINLSQHVCKPQFQFERQTISTIILFFRLYECRFECLSSTCRKFVSTLEQIYKISWSHSQLNSEITSKIFHEYHAEQQQGSHFESDHPMLKRSSRYAGLQNIGNTCYINSFMQALFMTKKFRNLVIKAQNDGELINKYPISEAVAQLFRDLSLKQNKTQIDTIRFKTQIPQPFCSSLDQHDSGEFGKILLDSISHELKGHPLQDKINRLFTSTVSEKIYCNGCKTPKNSNQTMVNFYLPVDDTSSNSILISDLWKKWFSGHQLDENNKIFCNKCNSNYTAKIQPQSINFADNIIITLNIFRYHKSGTSKIKKPLTFEFNINFKNVSNKITTDIVYELYAYILHIGTGIQRGHYQCFARNLDQNPMVWYNFDDSYVTDRQIGDTNKFFFGQNETPYILFYQRSKTQSSVIRV